MAITPLPTPPSTSDPANFNARADAFLGALPNLVAEINATGLPVNVYETGSWTPTVTLATPGTSSFAYTTRIGAYTRMGDRLFLDLSLSFIPTIGTGSGQFLITGLPIPRVGADTSGATPRSFGGFSWPSSRTTVAAYMHANTAVSIVGRGSAGSDSIFSSANLVGGAVHSIELSIAYRI